MNLQDKIVSESVREIGGVPADRSSSNDIENALGGFDADTTDNRIYCCMGALKPQS